jgi:hypothetical protein
MADDTPSSLVLFLISLALLGSFVGLLWAINTIKSRMIMSQSPAPVVPDRATEAVHVPVAATGIDTGAVAPASNGTASPAPDTDGQKAGTDTWEMPRISRRLTDADMIVLLAVQRTTVGKQRYSANQIAQLVGGSRAQVLALVKTIREGPAEFRPLTAEQQTTRTALGLANPANTANKREAR